jgi:hypothetical protein
MSASDIDLDLDDPLPPDRDLRKAGAVFAAVLLLVVAAAIVIPTVEAGAKSPSGLTAAGAASTVRQFVDQAVVQGDGYTACALLASPEQDAIARLDGPGGECRVVLGGDTSLLGVSTASDLDGLDLHTTVHGTTAVVTASAPGAAPVTFRLRPATAADRTIYRAPDAPWRIAAGAERVVTGAT